MDAVVTVFRCTSFEDKDKERFTFQPTDTVGMVKAKFNADKLQFYLQDKDGDAAWEDAPVDTQTIPLFKDKKAYVRVSGGGQVTGGVPGIGGPGTGTLRAILDQGNIPYQLSATVDTNPKTMVMHFTLTNVAAARELEAKLLIDDGSMWDLVIPAKAALKLGLQPFGPPVRTGGVGGSALGLRMEPHLKVTCTLKSDNAAIPEEVREAWLTATVFKQPWDDAVKATPPSPAATAASEPEATAAGSTFVPSSPMQSPKKKPKVFQLSPVRHVPNFAEEAIIGKNGLAELKLLIDPHRDRIYMLSEKEFEEMPDLDSLALEVLEDEIPV